MTDYKALIALAMERENDEWLGGLIGDLAEALKSSIEARAIDEGKMAAQADDLKDRIAAGVAWMAAEKVGPDLEEMDRALSEVRAALAVAQDRLFDLYLSDDGQAWDEAGKYLAQHRPDLFARAALKENMP